MPDWPPRFNLVDGPTPIHEARNLRAALGGPTTCPEILIKRDDLAGPGLGGNKARKLEFLVADALSKGATVLVTTGAVQSNHARLTCAAACVAGLRSALVLTCDELPQTTQGNLLLDGLFGAEVRFVIADSTSVLGDDHQAITGLVEELAGRGETPYLVSGGGSTPLGALGYVDFTRELVAQLDSLGRTPSRLYYASGSRGTQAGLQLGAAMYGAPYQLVGIAVSGGDPEKTEKAIRISNAAAALLGVPAPDRSQFSTDQRYIGPGYGIHTSESLEALRLVARTEGILLDPVYTAKAMAGLIDHVRHGLFDPTDTVVFLHTGGIPAIFANNTALSA